MGKQKCVVKSVWEDKRDKNEDGSQRSDCMKNARLLGEGMFSQFDKRMIYFAGRPHGRR